MGNYVTSLILNLCISHLQFVVFANTDLMWLIFSFITNSMTLRLDPRSWTLQAEEEPHKTTHGSED